MAKDDSSKVINDLLAHIKQFFDMLEKGDKNFVDLGKQMVGVTGKLSSQKLGIEELTKKHKHWMTQLSEESKIKKELKDIDKQLSAQKHAQKIELDRQHEEGVQRNIRLRHSLQDFGTSFSQVTNMLRGVTPMGAAGMAGSKLGGLVGARMRMTELQREIKDLESKAKAGAGKAAVGGLDPAALKLITDDIAQKKKSLKQDRDSPAGKIIESNRFLAKMTEKLEPLGEWIEKNSGGILISAVSLGLLVGLFKQMLNVSPMLQKMLELIGMTFGLILRPFGDFIGFILRPIAMAFLAVVIPFFKAVYPMLAKLGNDIGMKLASGDILGALFALTEKITLMDVLNFLFNPNPTENPEGAAGATGAVIAGAAVPAAIVSMKAGKAVTNRVFNKIRGGGGVNTGGSSSGAKQAVNNQKPQNKFQKIQTQAKAAGAKLKGMSAGLSPTLKNSMTKLAARSALRGIPYVGMAVLAAQMGFEAFKALNPEGYEELYNDAEWMGFTRDLVMASPENLNVQDTMLGTGVDPIMGMGGGHFSSSSTDSAGNTTINNTDIDYNIDTVNNAADAETMKSILKEHNKLFMQGRA